MEEAKAKVIELIYEIAVLEAKLDDVDYGQNTQIQQLAQYNADLKAELDSTKIKLAALNVELQAANAPNESDEIVAGIQQVVSNHKKRAGDNFANDPVGYMQFAFNYLEDRQADLRRAEDRIRELEKELKHHRSGGYWNPTNGKKEYSMKMNYVEDIREEFRRRKASGLFRGPTIEIQNAMFRVDAPTIFGSANEAYVKAELEWYKSRSLNVEELFRIYGKEVKIWKDVASKDGFINSNYGWCVYSAANGDQYRKVLNTLWDTPESRQAVMYYTRPTMHDEASWDGMRITCALLMCNISSITTT